MFELIFQKEYQPKYLLSNPILDHLAAQSVITFFLALMKQLYSDSRCSRMHPEPHLFPAFSPFPSPYLLSQPHSFLTCACLCPCVLHPGIKRNTVWTQPMPSKFLAASWLHGMEYMKLSATNKTHVRVFALNLPQIWIYMYIMPSLQPDVI